MPHLFTTETKNYRPLDRRNDYPWEIMRERLMRELGNEFATFLAEPVTRASEGFVDWYTESTEPAIPAADLTPEDRQVLFERLHEMRAGLYALADKIDAPGRRDRDKRFADAIRRATIVPSTERFVWSLGGQPTLVLWGMLGVDDERDMVQLVTEAVRDPRVAATKPTEAVEPVPSSSPLVPPRKRSLPLQLPLWLLFAALMGAIYYLLLINCDVAIGPRMTLLRPFGINACVGSFATSDGALRRQELQMRIQQAELDLARLQGDCETPQQAQALPPSAAPKPPSQTPNAQDICAELRARGASCRTDARLQISLGWKGSDDLDLRVTCPGGQLWRSDITACSGQNYLDTITPKPGVDSVENADWTNPPTGHYRIRVELFTKKSQPAASFTVIIKCGNEPIRELPGRITDEKQIVTIAELDYPSCR